MPAERATGAIESSETFRVLDRLGRLGYVEQVVLDPATEECRSFELRTEAGRLLEVPVADVVDVDAEHEEVRVHARVRLRLPLPRVAIVTGRASAAHRLLVDAWRRLGVDADLVEAEALDRLDNGSVALARLDVLESLDGIEPGLERLRSLERRGGRIVNRPDAILCVHDKLATARALAFLPHPATGHVASVEEALPVSAPLVVKPRFGSWGHDVFRCATEAEARACLQGVRDRPWFVRHGALVQELVDAPPTDLRLLVADGEVAGAVERTAARGEWRTNVSLGGSIAAVEPPREADELARTAALSTGMDFVGVDLLRGPRGWVVLELNGCVDFDGRYSLPGSDVYHDAAGALALRELSHAAIEESARAAVR